MFWAKFQVKPFMHFYKQLSRNCRMYTNNFRAIVYKIVLVDLLETLHVQMFAY